MTTTSTPIQPRDLSEVLRDNGIKLTSDLSKVLEHAGVSLLSESKSLGGPVEQVENPHVRGKNAGEGLGHVGAADALGANGSLGLAFQILRCLGELLSQVGDVLLELGVHGSLHSSVVGAPEGSDSAGSLSGDPAESYGPSLATADDVIAGRARYADTPGGHADRQTMREEQA